MLFYWLQKWNVFLFVISLTDLICLGYLITLWLIRLLDATLQAVCCACYFQEFFEPFLSSVFVFQRMDVHSQSTARIFRKRQKCSLLILPFVALVTFWFNMEGLTQFHCPTCALSPFSCSHSLGLCFCLEREVSLFLALSLTHTHALFRLPSLKSNYKFD